MKKLSIKLQVNGDWYELSVNPGDRLVDVLRDQLRLTGTKEGCGTGECGACTVLVDDVPLDSCLYLAVWADGRSVRTVEGETKHGRLSEVQQAYLDTGAVQCGFCTPGLIMTSTAFVEKYKGREKVSRTEIRRAHAGNLCRCTGYEGIIRAVEQCLTVEEDEAPEKAVACENK